MFEIPVKQVSCKTAFESRNGRKLCNIKW